MADPAITKPLKFLHEPATDFIENRVHLYGEAFANAKGVYDPSNQKYLLPEDSLPASTVNSTELQAKYFQEALVEFNHSHPIPKSLIQYQFQIRDKTTWDDIIKEVKNAEMTYFYVAGSRRIHHRVWRWFSRNAAGIRPYAEGIPQGDYTAIISASVQLIFNAAIRMETLREVSIAVLEDLEGPFEDVADYLELYAADERIGKATVALYVAILAALEEVLEFYAKPPGKHAKVLIKGEKYNVSMETKIAQIEAKAHKLVHQAEKKSQQMLRQYAEDSKKSDAKILNGILRILRDVQANAEWFPEQLQRALETHLSRPSESFITQPRLLELLTSSSASSSSSSSSSTAPNNTDTTTTGTAEQQQQLTRVLAACARQPLSQQSHALWLLRHPRLQRWLRSKRPDALLIHGNSAHLEKLSAASLLCAMLLRSLGRLASVTLTASFVCGIGRDGRSRPTALLRSLVVQLLRQVDDFDLSFLRYDDIELLIPRVDDGGGGGGGENEENVNAALCELFANLVAQLRRPAVLFCVLAGVNYYETEERVRGTGVVVRLLRDLVARGGGGGGGGGGDDEGEEGFVAVKLLIASPTKTTWVVRGFEGGDVITVPPSVAKEGCGINESVVRGATRRSLEQLVSSSDEEDEQELVGAEFEAS